MEAVRTVPDVDFEKSVGISHESLRGTLTHIHFADWIWYTRIAGPLDKPADTREALETGWPALHRKWETWAAHMTDADMNREVELETRVYGVIRRTPSQVVTHLVNHATLHRGQVMGVLRQMAIVPPSTDVMNFYHDLESGTTAASGS